MRTLRRHTRRVTAPPSKFRSAPIATSLIADFDPSWGVTGTTSVASWASRVGGVTVDQASAPNRPAISTINGVTALAFTGVEYVFGGASIATAMSGTLPWTAYYIGQLTNPATAGNKTSFASSNTTTHYVYCMAQATTGVDGVPRGDPTQTFSAGTEALTSSPFDHAVVYDGSTVATFVNGVASAASANARAPVCTAFSIGTLLISSSTSQSWVGRIGRMLIYGAAHDAGQIAATRAWLRAYYRL